MKLSDGIYPANRIKLVDRPTSRITDDVRRIDMRNNAYGLARRGEFGPAVQKGVQQSLPEKYPLSAAQKDLIDHIATFSAMPVADRKAPVPSNPESLTEHIKALGFFLKADQMGACKVPTSAYYSHDNQGQEIKPRFESAIVILMKKEWHTIHASAGSDWIGDPISFQAYAHLGLVAETIANYIRRLGWDAVPQYGPSFVNHYQVLIPPLLLEAGMGEVSRAGIILNPFLGLAYKAAAILTDMPIKPDKPIDFGLQKFCQQCKICAENCPSKAISRGDKILYNGYETWKLDVRRCASFNFTNKHGTMCNRCVKSCPWSFPNTFPHTLVRKLLFRSPLWQKAAIQGARWLNLGQPHPDEQWWFDFEYRDGEIKPAER